MDDLLDLVVFLDVVGLKFHGLWLLVNVAFSRSDFKSEYEISVWSVDPDCNILD